MSKFKVGDRVKIIHIDPCWGDYNEYSLYFNKVTSILCVFPIRKTINGEMIQTYTLEIDEGDSIWHEDELELRNRTIKLKRILDENR